MRQIIRHKEVIVGNVHGATYKQTSRVSAKPLRNMYYDDLPHEVILSIQRVLEINPTQKVDPLDGLTENFSAVDILNNFFPDGARNITVLNNVNAKRHQKRPWPISKS